MRGLLRVCGGRALLLLSLTTAGLILLDLFGIGAVFPFLSMVTNPAAVEGLPVLARARQSVGLAPDTFMMAVGATLVLVYLLRLLLKLRLASYRSNLLGRTAERLASELFSALLRARYATFTEHAPSEMVVVINGRTVAAVSCLDSLARILNEGGLVIALAACLLVMEPVAFLLVLICMGVVATAVYALAIKRLEGHGELHLKLNAAIYKFALGVAASIKDIKIMGLEEQQRARFSEMWRGYSSNDARARILRAVPADISETLVFVGLVGACLYLLGSRRDIVASLPVLGVVAVAALRVLPSLNRVISNYNEYRYLAPAVREVEQLLSHLETQRQTVSPRPLPFRSAIELCGVGLRIGDEILLRGLSVRIERGSTVAFVGLSGAGKSTLLDVIVGLREADEGEFRLDGEVFDPFRCDALRRLAGYVPQTVTLIDDTIAYNVTFQAKPEPERLARALAAARLTEFVASLGKGVETILGEGGVRLSGGQRQRIGIARALYRDPELLLLDEATSALDPVTERELMHEITRLKGDRTLILVTHRLSSVEGCDRIHVLERGRIVASGSHAELLAGSPEYRELLQRSREEPSQVDP